MSIDVDTEMTEADLDPTRHIFRFLDTNGDGSGTENANGDYSSTPGVFYFQNVNRGALINRMNVSVYDTKGIEAEEYGNLGSALGNGIRVQVTDSDDNEIVAVDGGLAITFNAGWAFNNYDVSLVDFGNTTNEAVLCRWSFYKSGLPLMIPAGYKFKVTCNDDLQGLITHYFKIDGKYL